jgi:hypothetical protein
VFLVARGKLLEVSCEEPLDAAPGKSKVSSGGEPSPGRWGCTGGFNREAQPIGVLGFVGEHDVSGCNQPSSCSATGSRQPGPASAHPFERQAARVGQNHISIPVGILFNEVTT